MNNKDQYLKLTYEDVGVLQQALKIRLENLRFELARTEDHAYQIDLGHQLDRLEGIDRELKLLPIKERAAWNGKKSSDVLVVPIMEWDIYDKNGNWLGTLPGISEAEGISRAQSLGMASASSASPGEDWIDKLYFQ